MENKHTPGPWVWTENGNEQYGEGKWLSSPSGMVLDYLGCGSHECYVEKADAMLIAAAPEMLKALQAVKDFIDGKPGAKEPFGMVRASIAKAIGAQ